MHYTPRWVSLYQGMMKATGEERKATIAVVLLAHGIGHLMPFMAAEAGLVVRRDWLRPGLAVLATGLITIGLLLVKPPLWVDGLVTVSVLVGLWWIYRPANRKAKPVTGKHTPGVIGYKEAEYR